MDNFKKRYDITPQMKIYDQLTVDFEPYTMFFNKKLFRSKIVNTDELGFRFNFFENKTKSFKDLINENDELSLVIGGSTYLDLGQQGMKKQYRLY